MKPLRVAIALAALLCAPAIARAELNKTTGPPPGIQPTTATLADVLAMNKKAEGKPLNSFASCIEEWSLRDSGSDGTEHRIWKGADYKNTDAFAPIITQDGRLSGLSWAQNKNGQVALQWGLHPEREAFDETLRSAQRDKPSDAVRLLGEVAEPAAFVVSVNASRGRPTWLFVAKSNGLVLRREEMFDFIRVTTVFSDFRMESGAMIAHMIKTTNGNPAEDSEYKLLSLRANAPVAPDDLAIPREHPHLVQFPTGSTSIQLPAEFNHVRSPFGEFGNIVVRVSINGRGLDFILDSGASTILLDKEVADSLGLRQFRPYSIKPGGPTDSSVALVPEMDIGDLKMKNVFVDAIPFNGRPRTTTKAVGLLGFDFLASVGLKIDFDNEKVTAYPAGTISAPDGAIPVPIQLDDFVPRVGVTVGSSWSDRFIFDLGADGLTIFPDFAAKHKADLHDQGLGKTLSRYIPDLHSNTAYGDTISHFVQIKRIVFGIPFDEFVADVVDPGQAFTFEDTDGLVGYPLYHYFNLYFDYENTRIMLEKNKAYKNAKKEPA